MNLIRCDINGLTAGYSSFTVLIDRMASSHIWASDRINLFSACQIYTNTEETNFINMSELYNLKNTSSNIQGQLDLKLEKYHVAYRSYGSGSIIQSYGKNIVNTGHVDTTGGNGIHKITMPPHPRGINYGLIATASNGSANFLSCNVLSSTQFTVFAWNLAGSNVSIQYSLHSID